MGPTPTRHYFKNVAPPSGFWPLLLAFGPPAAKSWRRVCRDENWNSRDQDRDSQKWVSRRVSLVIDVLTGHCRLVICVIDGHWCLESNSYSCFFFNSWKLILSTRKNLTKFVLEEAMVSSLWFWLRCCYLAKMIAYFSFNIPLKYDYDHFNTVAFGNARKSFRDDQTADFYYPILSCFWKMITVTDPNPVSVKIILSVSKNYPKMHYDAQHTFLGRVYFASWGKRTAEVNLPLAEQDLLK